MSSDDQIGFTPDLHLGIDVIDAQHRELFRHLDQLKRQPERKTNSEAFSEVLTRIGNELYEHFEAEEKYFRSGVISDADADAHAHAHTAIMMQLVDFNMALMLGAPPDYEHTKKRITDWLVSHVRTFDLRLRVN